MALSLEHEKLIVYIDEQVNKVLLNGGTRKEVLTSLAEDMNDLRNVMKAATKDELNLYCRRYEGFYYFMKLLEELALDLSRISILGEED